MELKCCKGCDKKCWILLLGIALILIGAIGFYLYAPEGGMGCLKLLPSEYCSTGQWTFYLEDELMAQINTLENIGPGQDAAGFINIPDGTELKAPFDGVYYPIEKGEGGSADYALAGMELTIPGTTSSVIIRGFFSSSLEQGATFKKGDVVATKIDSSKPLQPNSPFELIVYTIDYDLQSLFK